MATDPYCPMLDDARSTDTARLRELDIMGPAPEHRGDVLNALAASAAVGPPLRPLCTRARAERRTAAPRAGDRRGVVRCTEHERVKARALVTARVQRPPRA